LHPSNLLKEFMAICQLQDFVNVAFGLWEFGISNDVLWNILEIKFLENIESFTATDLIIFFYIFYINGRKIESEIHELFFEVLKIKVNSSNIGII
jgi:hypothetical protein